MGGTLGQNSAHLLLPPNRLTFLGTGLLGAEALLYKLKLEVEQLGESILEAGADWLPAPFRPRSPRERYLSLIFRLVLPLTAGEKVTKMERLGEGRGRQLDTHSAWPASEVLAPAQPLTSAGVVLHQELVQSRPASPDSHHQSTSQNSDHAQLLALPKLDKQ